MSFPRYPAYKDSGVEWLGQVPEHWEVVRLKSSLAQRITDGPHTTPEFVVEGVPFLSVDGIQDGELVFDGCRYVSTTDHKEFCKKVRPQQDDLLMGKAASTGKVARVKVNFEFSIWSPLALIRVKPNLSNPRFVEYMLKSPISQYEIDGLCTSNTQKNISMDDIPCLALTRPPISEQLEIAAFLDHETAKIDALIAEQQRLIELLNEKRQAVISHAVTKGLNPNVPMKPSGVEWLGDVPEHWEMRRLKYIGKAMTGLTYSPADMVNEGSGTLVLRSSNVQGGLITLDDNVYVSTKIPQELYTQIGDILICSRNGSRALIGKNAAIDYASAGVTFGAFMTVFRTADHSWVRWILNSPLFDFQSGAFMTSTINQLTLGVLNDFEIPMPPSTERESISLFLKSESEKLGLLTTEAQRAIKLLQERRSALISAAVTGQIDVRGFASQEAA